MNISTVAVIGAGVMGRGIALVCARAGYATLLFDLNQEMLDQAAAYMQKFCSRSVEKGKMSEDEKQICIDRLAYTMDLSACKADLIIEAVPENLAIKQDVFRRLAEVNPMDIILASNTSTIPISRIASGIPGPDRIIGLHFFNPAPLMKLVEMIAGVETDDGLCDQLDSFVRSLGKIPVKTKDEPGFIVNRVARQFYLESLRCVEEGLAAPETVDRIMESSGFRLGPFKLMDLIGIDTNHAVSQSMFAAFFQADRFRPSRLQQKMVDAGRFGKKNSKGFYEYL